MLGYVDLGRSIDDHDPAVNLLQWAGESADPPVYGRQVLHEDPVRARHVLMFQGIVDTYILPPIANSTSLSLGLDLAGDGGGSNQFRFRHDDDELGLRARDERQRAATIESNDGDIGKVTTYDREIESLRAGLDRSRELTQRVVESIGFVVGDSQLRAGCDIIRILGDRFFQNRNVGRGRLANTSAARC